RHRGRRRGSRAGPLGAHPPGQDRRHHRLRGHHLVHRPVSPPVDDDATRVSMAIRVPVFTLATVTLGVSAHLAAGGAPPAPGTLAILLVAVGLISIGLSHGEQRLPRVIAGVAAVQVGMHVAMLGHHPATTGSGQPRPLMTAVHAAAALTLAWWLRR